MNAITRTERAIKADQFGGPVKPYRVYARTTSIEHQLAGADYNLIASFDTRDAADDFAANDEFYGNRKLWHARVICSETPESGYCSHKFYHGTTECMHCGLHVC